MTEEQFMDKFATEEQCRRYLFSVRWENGFTCPRCMHTKCFEINTKTRHLFQCKSCNHQVSVTAGTVIDKSRTPLIKWFKAIFLMINSNWEMSGNDMMKCLNVSYNTAWTICSRLRNAKGNDDCTSIDELCTKKEFLVWRHTENSKQKK